jgi:uncharacterized protein YbaP (TraB family)
LAIAERRAGNTTVVKRLICALFAVCGWLVSPSLADTAAPLQTTSPEIIEAHPALWAAHGSHGTVYLLGSIHVLPTTVNWRTPEITKAIDTADVFVFEIPTDAGTTATVSKLIAERGTLKPGQSLRAMLSPEAQKDFDKALIVAGIPLAAIDNRRPWLAALVIGLSQVMKKPRMSTSAGLDKVLEAEAASHNKELRYLETPEQQLDLIAPKDDKLELEQFESGLKEFLKQNSAQETDDLIGAWESGNPSKIDALFNQSFRKYPKLRKKFLEDRNRNWVTVIRKMLDQEDKVFLVTVGAGHLVGRTGVPNLLRRAGYKVDGP